MNIKKELRIIIGCLLIATLTTYGALTLIFEAEKAADLQDLGYEVQVYNFSCYAQSEHEWIKCDDVIKRFKPIVW